MRLREAPERVSARIVNNAGRVQSPRTVADEVRAISIQQDRWIKTACAFPVIPPRANTRGINKTDWLRIDRATHNACLDPRDYRPNKHRGHTS